MKTSAVAQALVRTLVGALRGIYKRPVIHWTGTSEIGDEETEWFPFLNLPRRSQKNNKSQSPIEHEVTVSPRQKGFKTYNGYLVSIELPFEKGLYHRYFKEQEQSSEYLGGYMQVGSVTTIDISASNSVSSSHRFPFLQGPNKCEASGRFPTHHMVLRQ